MRLAVKDISEEDWTALREDYQDELSCMDSVDEDELEVMLYVSRKRKEKKNVQILSGISQRR